MPQVSIYWLNEYTYKDRRTIKKRLANLPKNKHGKYDSGAAFEAIYAGQMTELEGEFVSTPEAVRRLTIAKKPQIDLEMEIKRGLRIPIDDVKDVVGRAFQAVAATLKANRDKILTEAQINEGPYQNSRERGDPGNCLRDAKLKLSKRNQNSFTFAHPLLP